MNAFSQQSTLRQPGRSKADTRRRPGAARLRSAILAMILTAGLPFPVLAQEAASAAPKALSRAQAEEQIGALQDRLEPVLKALNGATHRAQLPLLSDLKGDLAKLAPQLPKTSSLRDQHNQLAATVAFALDVLELDESLDQSTGLDALQAVKVKFAAIEGRKTAADAAVKELLGEIRERLNGKLRALTDKQKYAASIPELEAKATAAATISELDVLANGPLRTLANDPKYAPEFTPQLEQVRTRITEKKPAFAFGEQLQALTRQADDCRDKAALEAFTLKVQELCRDAQAASGPYAARISELRDRTIPAIRNRLEQEESSKYEQILGRIGKAVGEVDRLLNSNARGTSARLNNQNQVWLCNNQDERLDLQLPLWRTKYEDCSKQLREFTRQYPQSAAGAQPFIDLLTNSAAILQALEGNAAYVKRANALIDLGKEHPEESDKRTAWVNEFESFRTSRDSRSNRLWDSLLATDARKYITELAKDILRPAGADGLREVLANCTRGLDTGKKISREEAKTLKQLVHDKAARFGWTETPPAKPDAAKLDRDMTEYGKKLERWERLDAQVKDSLRKIDSGTRGGGFDCCG